MPDTLTIKNLPKVQSKIPELMQTINNDCSIDLVHLLCVTNESNLLRGILSDTITYMRFQ